MLNANVSVMSPFCTEIQLDNQRIYNTFIELCIFFRFSTYTWS